MNFQPAQANGTIKARRVFRRRPFIAEQERAVEFLDVDPAILHRLEGVRVLLLTARGLVRISAYRHIPRMRAPISTFGPWPGVRAALPAGITGQAVRSNRSSSFSGMKRVLEA